jgi:hypothetical protein
MALAKYESSWIGIDSVREGLWRDPLWKGVIEIISNHCDERVYDADSPIYTDLERAYPKEAWRSYTKEGDFRPLFRDYPNSWTRTGVVSLDKKKFAVTELGQCVLSGDLTKANLLIQIFSKHSEHCAAIQGTEKPFCVLASGFLATSRPLSTKEIYWAIMKNYRPEADNLSEFIARKLRFAHEEPEATPYRRLRNMLSLMRASGSIASSRREGQTFWSPLSPDQLKTIAGA